MHCIFILTKKNPAIQHFWVKVRRLYLRSRLPIRLLFDVTQAINRRQTKKRVNEMDLNSGMR